MSYQLPVHPAYVSTTGSPSAQAKILIVEDELIVRRVLQRLLEQRGYAVTTAASAEEALALLELEPFDLLLTDFHLGSSDGVALMVSARRRDPALAVIIISGCAKLASAIAAMRSGAYNYIVKPGQVGEIEDSIVAALAHRQQQLSGSTMIYPSPPSPHSHLAEGSSVAQETAPAPHAALLQPRARSLQIGDLRIDIDRHQVSRRGERLRLSIIEFNMLVYLAERAEQVVTSQQLAHEVLGYRCDDHEARRLVKARIWSLRQRIEAQPSQPRLLVTIRGVGYRLTGEQ
jgi:DNA-binding response OmpR family regulator